jgi:hypothetical protein
MLFRYYFVNIFSFIKRIFSFYPSIYNLIVFLPLFTVFSPVISRKSIYFVLFLLFFLSISGNINNISNFIMLFLLLLSKPMFKKVNFESLLHKSFYFFLLVSLYGLYQKYFGYTIFELNWFKSGLSFADENGFLLMDDIRPFSTFASIPEFTFFISIYLFYFTLKKYNYLLFFTFFMLYIAGSRGVIISTLISYFFTFYYKKYNRKYLFYSFLISTIFFLSFIFIFPLIFSQYDTNSRILFYGSFNGRVELLNEVLNNMNLRTLILGLNLNNSNTSITFDNLYLMLITNFGIVGGFYFLYYFIKQELDSKSFYFLSIFLGYGFYADVLFSYYLMFLFFFAIYSRSQNNTHFKSFKYI